MVRAGLGARLTDTRPSRARKIRDGRHPETASTTGTAAWAWTAGLLRRQDRSARFGVEVGGLVVNKRSPADRGDFLARRHALEQVHLDAVRQALPHVPLVELPLLAEDVVGEEALDRFAQVVAAAT